MNTAELSVQILSEAGWMALDRSPGSRTEASTKHGRSSGIGQVRCPSPAAGSRALAPGVCPCREFTGCGQSLPTHTSQAVKWTLGACLKTTVTRRLLPPASLYNVLIFTVFQRLITDLTTDRSDERVIQAQGAEGACVECGRVQTIWLH